MKRAVFWIAAIAVALIALRSALYLADPNLPFGFYYDLAWNGMWFDYIAREVHSLRDAVDQLSWLSWYDQPTFYLNTMGTFIVLTPLAVLLHNAWLVVKLAQILQIFIAVFGTAYAYRVILRGTWVWGVIAGLAYALAPATAIPIRHDLDMGWAIVLLPPALALTVSAIRRIGAAALPLAGALIGIAAFCFHIEYGFFIGIPSYLICAVYALRREWSVRTAALAVLGMVVLCAVPAYTILTTMTYRSLYSDWAVRTSELDAAAKLTLFSESLWSFASATLQESIIDPNPLFNASASMLWAFIGGLVVWVAAIAYAVVSLRGMRRNLAVAITLCVLLVLLLAIGGNGPLAFVYQMIRNVPVLNALRTPDRFIVLPLFAACLAAAALGERAAGRWKGLALGLTVIVLVCWGAMDSSQHVLGTQTAEDFEPQLDEVSRVVATLGPRTFAATTVRGGSVFDTPAYGVPTRSIRSGTDILGRYIETPSAGLGLFARAGVRSLITTPDWLSDQSNAPVNVAAHSERSGLAQLYWHGRSGVSVYAVPAAREKITGVAPVCAVGGPGLADFVGAERRYAGAAFIANPKAVCTDAVRLSYDPRSAYDYPDTDKLAGTRIFGYLPLTGDVDYSYAVDRFYLNDRWYRDSVDGDAMLFSHRVLPIGKIRFGTALHPIVRTPQRYSLRVHMAVHALTRITVGAGGRTHSIVVPPEYGLRWFIFDLGMLHRGDNTVTIDIDPLSLDDAYGIFSGDLVDGVAFVPASALAHEPKDALPTLWTLDEIADQSVTLPAVYKLTTAKSVWQTTAPVSTLRVRWSAPSGRYHLSLRGRARGASSWISAGGTALTVTPTKDVHTLAAFDINARKGEDLVIRAGSQSSGSIPDLQISDIDAVSATGSPVHFADRGGRMTYLIDTAMGNSAFGGIATSGDVRIDGDHFAANGGAALGTKLNDVPPGALVLQLQVDSSGGGGGRLIIGCGGAPLQVPLWDTQTSLAVPLMSHSCDVRVQWLKSDWTLNKITARAGAAGSRSLHGQIWLAAGTYAFRVLDTPVRTAYAASLRVDGKAASSAVDIKAGWHTVQIATADPDAYALEALPAGSKTYAAVQVPSRKLSSTSYGFDLRQPGTVEFTALSDGYWRVRESRSGREVAGERCDLFETCFADLQPGEYRVYHAWPPALIAGTLISLLAVLGSCAGALFALRRRRQTAAQQRLIPEVNV